MLKRIVHPVALHARSVDVEIPTDAFPVGFDLMKADWVMPYGKGEKADFIFRVDRRIASAKDFKATLLLTFTNPGDGMIPVPLPNRKTDGSSALMLPAQAPEEGYQEQHTWRIATEPGKLRGFVNIVGREPTSQGYLFRVRTVRDPQGHIIQAMYGKIQRDVNFSPVLPRAAHAAVGMTFYLNPTGARDLEFDLSRNLFGKLPVNEEVREP